MINRGEKDEGGCVCVETGMVGVKVQRCGRKQALPLTHWDGRHGIERDNEAGVWTGDIM